ncbi:hypothetical protein PAXRUDRAFT_835581, partial [Paxillus rubicundulus Ve08.2h10]
MHYLLGSDILGIPTPPMRGQLTIQRPCDSAYGIVAPWCGQSPATKRSQGVQVPSATDDVCRSLMQPIMGNCSR